MNRPQDSRINRPARAWYGDAYSTGLIKGAAIAIGALALTACTTTGVAVGRDVKTGKAFESVTFVWKSDPGDSTNGKIEVTLPDGRFYTGRYHQVTKTSIDEELSPFWDPWPPYWSDWAIPWDDVSDEGDWDEYTEFITKYDQHIIARLEHAGGGPAMRCRFTLRQPIEGMAGGGQGDCTIGRDERIEDAELSKI